MTFVRLILVLVWTVVCLLEATAVVALALRSTIQFRTGERSDAFPIATTMVRQLMNPLDLRPERFVVAVDASMDKSNTHRNHKNSNSPIGWAQIRPLGTAQRDPSSFNARPGSLDLERDADDAMWEEFDKEDTVAPIRLASLPWTKEYRDFSEAARKRRERRDEIRRENERNGGMLYELASVYVLPEYRGQGIGTELIQRVLQRHVDAGRSVSDVYLLTLATTVAWYYESFGFDIVPDEDVPQQMAFEVTAGKIVTKLIGAKLCCMRGTDS